MVKFSFTEQQHATNLYACVLARGENPAGVPCYCYFGVFLRDLEKIQAHLATGRVFNPRDFNCIVLARSVGEPTDEIRAFMRRKFSFGEDCTILELSRPAWSGRVKRLTHA